MTRAETGNYWVFFWPNPLCLCLSDDIRPFYLVSSIPGKVKDTGQSCYLQPENSEINDSGPGLLILK